MTRTTALAVASALLVLSSITVTASEPAGLHGEGGKALHLTVRSQGDEIRSSVAPWQFHR